MEKDIKRQGTRPLIFGAHIIITPSQGHLYSKQAAKEGEQCDKKSVG